jgi:hypothetical protein
LPIKPNNNVWLHPLYIENPEKYTQRGKVRKTTNGRFTPGTKLQHRSGSIPQKIKDILIGCLLGDASGQLLIKGKTPYFEFKQGMVHADYLYFLYFIFANWGYTSSNVPLPKYTKDSKGNIHQSLRFKTLAIPNLKWIYEIFYPEGTKVLPNDISNFFNPRVLAFWIMDDGSWTGSGILIHCNNFNLLDVERLSLLLKETFNLRVSIRIKGKYHILYIHAESIPAIRMLVKDYIHPSFNYKLGLSQKKRYFNF